MSGRVHNSQWQSRCKGLAYVMVSPHLAGGENVGTDFHLRKVAPFTNIDPFLGRLRNSQKLR